MSAAQAVHRRDYRAPDYLVDRVELDFDIREQTTVVADLVIRRGEGVDAACALRLDGRGMELIDLQIDGVSVEPARLTRDDDGLSVAGVPAAFALRVVTRIDPETNRSLEGFYRSGPMLCTQCEARGFSRITYFPDRPDVLSRYRVRLEADVQRYPVLLSNGNRIESGAVGEGRHYAVWDDPFLKPCYLFALVAGDLACVSDHYTTGSGRAVLLQFFVDHGNESRVPHAMESLKKAMRWDEQVYGLEYDLDIYMVVAAREFNMGAMENKGLNLFNARFVLASPETATDADYEGIESVIAHEYFHNWTGNRVTCRDWFQLSLKEGLTVFRDQSFSADLNGADVQRIGEVRQLRTIQFAEDAGPMAHSVRPESYVEINNFYTATVYEKGAEIVRMLQTLLGRETFIEGVRHYLRTQDGKAATIEDFLAAHETVSGRRLEGFRRWYSQAGTPTLGVEDEYDLITGHYTLRFDQATPATPDQPTKQPVPIPIRVAFRDGHGQPITLPAQPPLMPRPDLILLEDATAEITFEALPFRPTPSFLLGFSAPVRLEYGYSTDQLANLLLHEDDGFARWEAGQRLMLKAFLELLAGAAGEDVAALLSALQQLAANPPENRELLAELLRMPSESYLATQLRPLDGERLAAARDALRLRIAQALTGPLSVWVGSAPEELGAVHAGRRALANVAAWYLAATRSARVLDLCRARADSFNMTLSYGALVALNDIDCEQREAAMAAFLSRWRHDALVLDKWFALQAGSALGDGVARVKDLLQHPDYVTSPNRIRAVLGTFWRENLRAYHRADGAGYRLLAGEVGTLERHNPQLASRLADGLLGWRELAAPRDALLRAAIVELATTVQSPDVGEKLARALAD